MPLRKVIVTLGVDNRVHVCFQGHPVDELANPCGQKFERWKNL